MHVHMCAGTLGSQERGTDTLELKLQEFVSHMGGHWEPNTFTMLL